MAVFLNILGILSVVVMDAYFIWNGIVLLRGGEGRVPGFSLMTERDQSYYDIAKVKKFAGIGYLVAAFGVVILMVGQFTMRSQLLFGGLLLFLLGFGVPYQLLKRSNFFIKK